MIETRPARPTPLSRVWSGPRVIAEDLAGDDLSDVLAMYADASAWWVVDRSAAAAASLAGLAAALDLRPDLVADLLSTAPRARYEEHPGFRMVRLSAVALPAGGAAELEVTTLALLVTDRALVCVADPGAPPAPARLLVGATTDLESGGVDAGLRALVAAVLGTYDGVACTLEAETEQLAAGLEDGQPLTREEQFRVLRLRRVLSRLRRLHDPVRAVLDELVADAHGAGRPPAGVRAWELLRDAYAVTAHLTLAVGEDLAAAFDTSTALADIRATEVTKKLSGWAAVVAVPTLITGFVGQNVAFPLAGTTAGFWVYLVLLVASAAGLYALFRRQGWI